MHIRFDHKIFESYQIGPKDFREAHVDTLPEIVMMPDTLAEVTFKSLPETWTEMLSSHDFFIRHY